MSRKTLRNFKKPMAKCGTIRFQYTFKEKDINLTNIVLAMFENVMTNETASKF